MSSLGFISLDELWGDNYSNNYNEKTNIDYTGGNKFETALEPMQSNQETPILQNQMPEGNHAMVTQENVSNQPTPVQDEKIKKILEKIDDRIKKLEKMVQKRDKQIIEGFSNNSTNYFDLLILIGLGILIIYVLDSVMKMGRN